MSDFWLSCCVRFWRLADVEGSKGQAALGQMVVDAGDLEGENRPGCTAAGLDRGDLGTQGVERA